MVMHSYIVPFCSGEPEWNTIETAPLSYALWLKRPEKVSAYAQVCYDYNYLKVRLTACETDPLARSTGLTDFVHIDSALEFFFSPCAGDPRYFNFEFNALGTIYLGFALDRNNAVRQCIPDYRSLFAVQPFKKDGHWGIEFAIPVSFIALFFPQFNLHKGLVLRGNFYKCGDETATPHYLAWNPVESDMPNFHRPDFFGELRLD